MLSFKATEDPNPDFTYLSWGVSWGHGNNPGARVDPGGLGEEEGHRLNLSLGQDSLETRVRSSSVLSRANLGQLPVWPAPSQRSTQPHSVQRPGPKVGMVSPLHRGGLGGDEDPMGPSQQRDWCPGPAPPPQGTLRHLPWPRCPGTCISCTGSTGAAARRNSTSCLSCRWRGSRWHMSTPEIPSRGGSVRLVGKEGKNWGRGRGEGDSGRTLSTHPPAGSGTMQGTG